MADDERGNRREFRKELLAVGGLVISLLAPLTSALGYPPLAKIWSGLAVALGFIIVAAMVLAHNRGAGSQRPYIPSITGLAAPVAAVLTRPFYLSAIIFLLVVSGAWLQANVGNILTLAIYGSISDLDVARAANVA